MGEWVIGGGNNLYHSREAPSEGGATATLDNSLNKTDSATSFVVF